MYKSKKLFLILVLFMVVLCIGAVSASDDTNADDVVGVDNAVAVDEVASVVGSDDGSIADLTVENPEAVDDSGNESLATSEEEPTQNTEDTNIVLSAENENQVSGQTYYDLGDMDVKRYSVADHSTLKHADFKFSNTIFYLDEGTYNVQVLNLGGSTTSSNVVTYFNNIVIKPEDNDTVIINIDTTGKSRGILFRYGENITLENLKFTTSGSLPGSYEYFFGFNERVKNVYIRNCTFENMTNIINNPNYGDFIRIAPTSMNYYPIVNIHFEGCNFVNCNASYLLKVQNRVGMDSCLDSIYFTDCIFNNSFGTKDTLFLLNADHIYLENNTFNSSSAYILISSTSKLYSDVSFNVLTESLSMNTPNDIYVELVDDNGNRIYSAFVNQNGADFIYSSYLNFTINGKEKTPSFDRTTGLYKLSYAPENTDSVMVSVSCDNVALSEISPVVLKVLEPSGLAINGTDSLTYGDTLIYVNATLKEDVNGENVTFTLQGTNVLNSTSVVVNNGFAEAYFNQKLSPGSYTLSVSYAGNDDYGASTVTKALTVNKLNPNINVNIDDIITVLDNVVITVTVPEEVTGQITVQIGKVYKNGFANGVDTQKTVNVVPGGNVSITYSPLAASDGYEYAIGYSFTSTNSNYASYSNNNWFNAEGRANLIKFTVVKLDSNPVIDVDDIGLGDNASISVSGLSENATGTVTYFVDDDVTGTTLNVGETYNVAGLGAGQHTVRIVYSGDANYSGNETTRTFNVHTITLKEDVFEFGSVVVSALVPEGCEGSVQLIGAGEPVSADITNGVATFDLSTLTLGTHTLTLLYNGKYNINATASITVNPIVSSLDELTTGENTLGIKLPEGATGNLTIIIDDREPITVPVTDGSASYPINDLSAGNHKITMSYTDGTYSFTTGTQEITVAKTAPAAAPEVPAVINSGSAVSIPLVFAEDATGIVLYDINGKKYYVELVNGTADLDLGVLSAGENVVAYRYLGDAKYAESSGNVTFNVTKIDTVISAGKVTANYATAKNLVVTLKDNNGQILAGKKVTVKVGAISKTLTTNKNGQVSVDVSTLAPNTYTAKFTFAGDDVYTASSGSVSVKVNKGASKLTAAKKTFKVKANKKYTVTLKSGKKAVAKVKVTLKIGKKTYFAKTNAKGQATFNLKLAKGTYKPVVKFAGNKYYKGTTAKTTIIVK